MLGEDRLTRLLAQTKVTGIDFVQVVDPEDQRVLRVYFLIDPDELDNPIVASANLPEEVGVGAVQIVSASGGERLPVVPVVRATYRKLALEVPPRTVLEIETREPGDFSIYRLTLAQGNGASEPRIDRFFNGVEFSFKQGCPSVLDCRRREAECPPDAPVDFPVDYLARDFVSLRNALLDFAAQRYPAWSERIEADAGVMLAEVMAALGDELAYIQDRYAREAYLETASQRRSVRRHARLVDYPIHDGLAATTFLDLTVKAGGKLVEAGQRVWAVAQGESPVAFSLGRGLLDTAPAFVHEGWNELRAHIPDEAQPCLPAASTEVFVVGSALADNVPGGVDAGKFWAGRWLLLRTEPKDPAVPARRHLVRVLEIEVTADPLADDPIITRVRWEAAQALPFELCLKDLVLRGNLVFATAGETFTERFVIRNGDELPPGVAERVSPAVERQGLLNELTGRREPTFLYSLQRSEAQGLGWLGELRNANPEVELEEVQATNLQSFATRRLWKFRRTLLDSQEFDDHFTLEDGTWRRIIAFQRAGELIEHVDYASGAGFSLRFGDGEFGRVPEEGAVFQVRYRTGPGARANVAADSIVHLVNPVDASQADLAAELVAVTNPLPVDTGVEPESAAVIRELASQAFRALTLRAVRPEDYAEIAERLPFVQRAGARFRWTGSWLSASVSVDPLGAFALDAGQQTGLVDLMDSVRQAGREVLVKKPRFANLDLEVAICIEPSAFAGQVKARVLEALIGRKGLRPRRGFFDPDNFTFGTPLRRAALESVIQDVSGVLAVEEMRLRLRGSSPWRCFDELTLAVRPDEVLRLQNDPRFPERGSLRITTPGEARS
jgi:hypothetical protein